MMDQAAYIKQIQANIVRGMEVKLEARGFDPLEAALMTARAREILSGLEAKGYGTAIEITDDGKLVVGLIIYSGRGILVGPTRVYDLEVEND